MLFFNVYPDGCLLEEEPAERSLEIRLPAESERCVLAILSLESFQCSKALADLTKWALDQAGVATRRPPNPAEESAATPAVVGP